MFEFDEFLEFANNFHKSLRDELFIESVMNELGNVMLLTAKEYTPVGQYDNTVFFVADGKLLVFEGPPNNRQGGELRRNWNFEGVTREGDAYVVTISNNTEYASWVENGHRKADRTGWVEGKFFLKITMEEIMERLPHIVGPAYKKYLEGFGFS